MAIQKLYKKKRVLKTSYKPKNFKTKFVKTRPSTKQVRTKKFKTKKKPYSKPRGKKLTYKQLQLLRDSKPASLELNLDFYRAAEGVYNSY